MSRRSREWKAWRAAVRGELQALPEDQLRSFRQKAEEDRAAGYGWFVDGLEGMETGDIFRLLAGIGLDVDEASFRSVAEGQPGPREVSDAWERAMRATDEREVWLPFLAARVLWARLCADDPSVESEADAIEQAIRASRKAGPAERLAALERIAVASEGSADVFDALDDELHLNLGSWVVTQIDQARGVEDVEPWVRVVGELSPVLGSHGLIEVALATLLTHNGDPDRARGLLGEVLAQHGDISPIVRQAAEVYLDLEDGPTAERVASRAIVIAEDDDEAGEVREVLAKALALQGRAAEAGAAFTAALAERRRRELERRAERRKKERKGGKKGKRR